MQRESLTPGVGRGTAQYQFAQLQHAEHSQPNGLVSLKAGFVTAASDILK